MENFITLIQNLEEPILIKQQNLIKTSIHTYVDQETRCNYDIEDIIMQHQILQKNITIKSEKFCDFFFFTSVLQDSFSVFIPLTK